MPKGKRDANSSPPPGGGIGGGRQKKAKLGKQGSTGTNAHAKVMLPSLRACPHENDRKESVVVETPREVAEDNVVVFVERERGSRRLTDEEVRAEMEKFFPQVRCKAYMQADRSVRIQSFMYATDIQMMTSINWETEFPEKGIPFGSVLSVHKKTLPPAEQVTLTVALLTGANTTVDTVEKRLRDEMLRFHSVTALKTKVGAERQLMRVVLKTESDLKRATEDGVRIGYKATKAMPWALWQKASRRCFGCQRRVRHHAGCRGISRCPRCASPSHTLGACNAQSLKCPNCGGGHASWSFACSDFAATVRKEATRLALPYPSHWAGFSMNAVRVHAIVQGPQHGRRFADVAAGRNFADVAAGRRASAADVARAPRSAPAMVPRSSDHSEVRQAPQQPPPAPTIDTAAIVEAATKAAIASVQQLVLQMSQQLLDILAVPKSALAPAPISRKIRSRSAKKKNTKDASAATVTMRWL